MKKYFLFPLIVVALAAIACNREDVPASSQQALQENAKKASLKINLEGTSSATKADIQTADEASVKSLQVFVFNGDMIDVYGKIENASSLTLDATVGARTVWAVVNAPDLSAVKTMSALKASVSAFTDNGAASFVMAGSVAVTLSASSNVTVPVSRLASRIVIGKVTRNFSSAGLAALSGEKFTLVRAYMIDVPAQQKYDRSMTAFTSWIASPLGDNQIAVSNALLCKAPSSETHIAQSGSYSWNAALYSYPNPTQEDGTDALVTRIVLECQIDGAFYTYPVLLSGGVGSNKSYEIKELVLTRLGNPSNGDNVNDEGEDAPITSVEIPFGVSVTDWELVLLGDNGTVTI